jgi:predicted amidohydrolase
MTLGLPVLATVQLSVAAVPGAEGFEDFLLPPAIEARERGAELVLFPGYLGLTLLEAGWNFEDDLRRACDLRWTYIDACARVARAARVHLVPGTMVERGPEGLVHAAYLFSPRGEILARRLQVHLLPRERSWGLTGGHALEALDTPWGKVGLLLGSDVRYPEVGRILALQGARLFLAPAAHVLPTNTWRQAAGAWREAQANQVYVAEACLQGELGGLRFEGCSGIYAPNEITPGESGVVARAGEGRDLLTVALDGGFADGIRRYRPLELMAWRIYARDMPVAYAQLEGGGTG